MRAIHSSELKHIFFAGEWCAEKKLKIFFFPFIFTLSQIFVFTNVQEQAPNLPWDSEVCYKQRLPLAAAFQALLLPKLWRLWRAL